MSPFLYILSLHTISHMVTFIIIPGCGPCFFSSSFFLLLWKFRNLVRCYYYYYFIYCRRVFLFKQGKLKFVEQQQQQFEAEFEGCPGIASRRRLPSAAHFKFDIRH